MTARLHASRRRLATLVAGLGLAVAAIPVGAAAGAPAAAGGASTVRSMVRGLTSTDDGSAVRNITTPYFVGTPKVGYTLSARPGRWDARAVTVSYTWFDDTRLLGSGPTYVVGPADLGHTISVTATAEAPGRTSTSVAWTMPRVVVRGTFWIKGRPTIDGRATVGRRLTARSSATEPAGRRTYRWLRDGRTIRGAGGSTYRVTKADRRHRLTVRVVYTAAAYDEAARTSRHTHRVR